MSVMQKTHGSAIFLSEEIRRFEKLNFLKKSSYSFMQKAGYEVFKFIMEPASLIPGHGSVFIENVPGPRTAVYLD